MKSDAQKRAEKKYSAKMDLISIRQPKGWKDRVKGAAEKAGMSLAGYIREAVDEKMEGDENNGKKRIK
jgi:predicted DNA-binding protein